VPKQTLEERLKEVESQLAALKAEVELMKRPTDWRSAVDKYAGDENLQRIFEAGRKIREEDRRRTKPKPSKSKRRART
jgi:uncharacterized protein YutE (UPF0331/DUF86 family)